MAKYLVIVESPTKVKSISKFLGSNYTVMASNGHVRDLPKSQLGIDVENDFEPKYITIRGKGELLGKLRKEAAKADRIYLATDPDREGEAISWHLISALNLPEQKVKRITFNEITRDVVKQAVKAPRDIDQKLVDAQQARRALDRIVGYRISPLLWKKVKRGLSAGRVQSVALKMIAEREEQISAFVPEEYWTIDVKLGSEGTDKSFEAHYHGRKGKKEVLTNEAQVNSIIKELENRKFEVREVKSSERSKKAPFPFTTSTLQQEANKQLNFAAVKTMQIAQQLYEGVEIKGRGTTGLITYLRTDSTRISETADAQVRDYIEASYGSDYVVKGEIKSGNSKHSQDAHEAIRPADVTLTPSGIKSQLTRDQFRLYQLIWSRFVASRMSDAVYQTTNVRVTAGDCDFTSSASTLGFKGFMTVYSGDEEKSTGNNKFLASLTEGAVLTVEEWKNEQHFTQPPAHYTESALIKSLEELGVGRPSTYAPTIATIIARRYVTRESRNLYITEVGEVVNNIMETSFPDIVDANFTADMENSLDAVEEGSVDWKQILRDFYPHFDEEVKQAESELEKVSIADEVTDVICDNCGRNMVIKYGAFGKFLACPGFPECKNTKPYLEKAGAKCPKCGGEVVYRKTRKGRRYYGCENNPECDYMSWTKPGQK